jgi:hypothetical protein
VRRENGLKKKCFFAVNISDKGRKTALKLPIKNKIFNMKTEWEKMK